MLFRGGGSGEDKVTILHSNALGEQPPPPGRIPEIWSMFVRKVCSSVSAGVGKSVSESGCVFFVCVRLPVSVCVHVPVSVPVCLFLRVRVLSLS